MISNEHVWVIILAAGEGERVKNLTCDRWGNPAPKQYSSIGGTMTLLGTTLERAKKIVPVERIVPIVAAQHRCWWASELAEIPPENVVVQPANRGTAAGILLPLLWVTRRDPDATVVFLPSDHYIAREEAVHAAIMETVTSVACSRVGLALLGVKPDGPETDYGWIVPLPCSDGSLRSVASFREKPDAATSAALIRQGALLNSFIQVADGRFLLNLFEAAQPRLWRSFQPLLNRGWGGAFDQHDVAHLYRSVPILDFSKNLLEGVAERLWVYPVAECGWLDLGTPERFIRHLTERGHEAVNGRKQSVDRGQSRGARIAAHARPVVHTAIQHTSGAMGSVRV